TSRLMHRSKARRKELRDRDRDQFCELVLLLAVCKNRRRNALHILVSLQLTFSVLLEGEKVFRRLVFQESVTGRRQDVSRYVSLRQHVAVPHRKNSFDMLQAEAPMPRAFLAALHMKRQLFSGFATKVRKRGRRGLIGVLLIRFQ